MNCPNCGAVGQTGVCSYCGTKFDDESSQTVVVNNYYYDYGDYVQNNGAGSSASQLVSPKSRLVALILCVFLGFLGIHRFYAGRIFLGILYLLTVGGFGFAWIVDIFLVATGRMRDSNGLCIARW